MNSRLVGASRSECVFSAVGDPLAEGTYVGAGAQIAYNVYLGALPIGTRLRILASGRCTGSTFYRAAYLGLNNAANTTGISWFGYSSTSATEDVWGMDATMHSTSPTKCYMRSSVQSMYGGIAAVRDMVSPLYLIVGFRDDGGTPMILNSLHIFRNL